MEKENHQQQQQQEPVRDGTKVDLSDIEKSTAEHDCVEEKAPSTATTIEAEDVEPVVPSEPVAEYEYIKGFKLFTVMAAVTLVIFLMMLDMSIVVTAIPRITSDFHSLQDVGWYGSVYLLASCAVQPLTGKIYTQFSSKYTFLCFLGIFELGSVICGAAVNSDMLIIGRTVSGLGISGLMNGGLTIIAACVPMHKRPAMMGVMMSLGQIGIIGGPLIGGVLTQYASWRWCFYINLPIGGIAAVLLLAINIPDRLDKNSNVKHTIKSVLSQLDLVGFSVFAPFSVMILMALQWGGQKYPWDSATIIGLFCGGGAMLIIFLAWEHHIGDKAMIPFSVLRKTVVWCSCLVIGFFFASLLVFTYYLPIYFQSVKGVSPTMSGVYMLPSVLSQMAMAIISGILVGKLGYYLPWAAGSAVIVSIAAGLMSTLRPDTPTGKWIGYQILAGLGRGCGLQMPIVAIQNVLPPAQIPIGMALIMFCQTFGGGLFLAFAQTIFSRGLEEGLAKYAPTVDARAVILAGATAIRKVVKPDQLQGVLEAYNLGINHAFYLAAGSSVATFAFSWGMGWGSVKKAKKVVTPEA